jgi:peptide/nickel transport system substrate-binding protein
MMCGNRSTVRTRRRARVAGAAALALAASSGLAACSVAGSEGSTAGGSDTIRIVLPEEPPTLESCDATSSETGTVVRSNITEPLIELNPTTSKLEPWLATEWEQVDDTTWTFTLRDGVKFSDGSDFNAESAAFTIERAINSDLGCDVEGTAFGDTDLTVEATDATTLTVTTPEPDPILPLRLSFIEMVPTSTSESEKVREPIGTGPYVIDSWESGTRISLVANEEYWGEEPNFANASYVWRDQGSVRAAMVLNDEADLAVELGPDDGAGENEVAYANNITMALRMQVEAPPLDDIRVRQAIQLATDREGITETLLGEGTTLAAQLVTSGIVGFNDALEPTPFDPERARALLAEAEADGVDLSEEILLAGSVGGSSRSREVYQVIQKNLTDIGLNVKIEFGDDNFTSDLRERPFSDADGAYMLIVQHGNQAGDSVFTMNSYIRSDAFQSSGGTEELDALIDEAETLSGEERREALAKVWEMEPVEVAQFSYIAHLNGIIALNPKIEFEPNPATGDEMRLSDMRPKA